MSHAFRRSTYVSKTLDPPLLWEIAIKGLGNVLGLSKISFFNTATNAVSSCRSRNSLRGSTSDSVSTLNGYKKL
jgi:hypothetical protein